MRVFHNPFTMRSSETIESQMTFLKLFGSGILNVLRDDYFLNKMVIFRSSPGGGKTSLLRLFTPDSLREIFQRQAQYRDLFNSLEKYGAVSENGPALLGVYLRLSEYGSILDLNVPTERKSQYLFSSIGYRLIIKALLGILKINGLEIKDLERIYISKPIDMVVDSLELPCNGKELYKQASEKELEINRVINRFDVTWTDNVKLMLDFEHLQILTPENILLDGKCVVSKTLIMLDDIHELRRPLRKALLTALVPKRFPVTIWLAERLEALELPDLVPEIPSREYDSVYFETFWECRPKSFESFVKSVSRLRTAMAKLDVEIDSLDQHHLVNEMKQSSEFKHCLNGIKNKLVAISERTSIYNKWIAEQNDNSSQTFNGLIDWRVLEIKIEREEANVQTKLVDTPLDDEPDSDTNLDAIAKFLLHSEYGVPYYFGFTNIVKLATFNIDQFLEIASALFDEIESQMIKNANNSSLSPLRQEAIIKKVAAIHWKQIRGINNGIQTINFLTKFKNYAISQTLRPTAPYSPGVTGFGILHSDYEKFIERQQVPDGKYKYLAKVLQTCLSHNLLKVKYYSKQGKKGNEFVIFYLNRLLCAHFDLPLDKGGWRKKTPRELCNWIDLSIPKIYMNEVE